MPGTSRRGGAAAALVLLAAPALTRAEPVGLRFEEAIYADGAARPGVLRAPEGVACNDAGAVLVADTGNGRLVNYTVKEGRLTGGTELKLPQLTSPSVVQLDAKGDALVLDRRTRRIVRVDRAGKFQGTVEFRGAGGQSVVPAAFKLGAGDALYVLDGAGRRVLASDTNGVVKREIALPKSGQFVDVAVDAAGTVYAVDAVAAAVWVAPKAATEFSPLTKGMKDKMSFPAHIVATRGKILLVDQHGNGIVVLGIDGGYQGRQLSIGWSEGFVYYPSQLCVTDAGLVVVADRYNNRVQRFSFAK